jgi:phage portal protein BeeE
MIGLGAAPHFATGVEPLLQLYYSQCLQSLLTNFEQLYDEGVGLADPINGTQYGVAFDIDDLVWMDTATKTKAAADAIGAGAMAPDEARWKYFGLGPVTGGDTPYMQQQMFSLKALAQRDAADPFAKPAPAPLAAPAQTAAPTPSGDHVKHIDVVVGALLARALEAVA